jgi:hypothetical protein
LVVLRQTSAVDLPQTNLNARFAPRR